jgi:hypothetical protein
MSAPVYSVTLHHLSPDAKAAGLNFPDEHLLAVPVSRIRDLLTALTGVAAEQTIYEPASPEIRIKTDRDVFVIRTRYRRLCLVGWESMLRGENHSISYILTVITGSEEHIKTAPKSERGRSLAPFSAAHSTPPIPKQGVPRWTKILVMMVLIIGFNGAGVWLLMRPTPSLAPKYTILPDPESRALLTKVAGEYETGGKPGDRRLVIEADGTMRLAKFGPQRAILEESTRVARGGLADGRAALVTNDPYVLTIKDADTVVLYGNTYRRRNN